MRISLVTPNFNYGHFLEATLRSVLEQQYPHLEYIVMDGGSTDDSVDVIKRYEDKISHWESMADEGMYPAIAAGLNRSSGQIMGWLNSDDMHMPWTLRAVSEIFETFPEVDWITTQQPAFWDYKGVLVGLGRIDGFSREAFLDGRNFSPLTDRPSEIDPAIQLQGCLQQESTFWRRSLWEIAGGYLSQEFGSAGDFELWCRFLRHAEPCGVSVPLAGFRLQHQQQSADRGRYGSECLKALRRARTDFGWKPSALRSLAFRWGLRHPARVFARCDYQGTLISRGNIDSPDAGWQMHRYRFR